MFALKLITNSLATWENKCRRKIETTNTCVICGMETETTFHAFCRCPMARDLWNAMAETWKLPVVDDMFNTGSEWLLHQLDRSTETEGLMLLMTLWRIWHVQNEVVHHKPPPPIEASKRFLCSYLNSLPGIKQHSRADSVKGKMIVNYDQAKLSGKDVAQTSVTQVSPRRWSRPPNGTIKLNVDGSFSAIASNVGTGMVLRDHNGAIKLSACRFPESCMTPLEACKEGIGLVLEFFNEPCIVEMDFPGAISMIKTAGTDRSTYTFIVQEIKRLMCSRHNIQLISIHRDENSVSHTLANLGRTNTRTMTWIGSGPVGVLETGQRDIISPT
uniref:Uncharacterized protein n=1 Tax=Avena sativa TaxID=4498 RepID=A0ACD5Y6I0_AVESA